MGVCVVIGATGVKAPIFQSNIVVCTRLNCGAARIQIANSTVAPGLIALRLSSGAGLSANLLLPFLPDEKVLLVHPRRYRGVEKTRHHFVVSLLASAPLCLRIRIVCIRL